MNLLIVDIRIVDINLCPYIAVILMGCHPTISPLDLYGLRTTTTETHRKKSMGLRLPDTRGGRSPPPPASDRIDRRSGRRWMTIMIARPPVCLMSRSS